MAIRVAVFLFLFLVRLGFSQDAAVARVTAGLEQTASGSVAPVQKLSLRFYFVEPLTPRVSAWGDLRLSSLPSTISSTLATFAADTTKIVSATPVSQLVRTGEVLVGASYKISGSGMLSTVHAIASVGAAMPLQPLATQNRFLRQYYGGVRVASAQKMHSVDLSIGQNEAVTGGGFHGAVLRFDALYGLPLSSGNIVYLFGTVMMRASPRNAPGDTGGDSYRIGISADIFQILKALRLN